MANHFLPEEHEHGDYYSRKAKERTAYCGYSFKALTILTVIYLLVLLLFGCASAKRYPATTSTGIVISVDGDEVLVSFEVVTQKPGSQAAHWFYVPGHRYRKGDRYPDPDKDPTLR